MKFLLNIKIKNKGFTILELLVSLTIFAIMTALLLSKYGTFNQGVILTNLAYDIALTVRNAQMYGLNVKSSGRTTNDFSNPYGVYFDTSSAASKILVISFIDLRQGNSNPDNLYNNAPAYINPATGMPYEFLTSSTIKNGGYIGSIKTCNNYNCNNPITRTDVSIVFKRPKPDAMIYTSSDPFNPNGYKKVMIDVKSSDGNTKTVTITDNGEISVNQ